MTSIPCEVGQTYASLHKSDVSRNHNQQRVVLAVEDVEVYRGGPRWETIRKAKLTCDGSARGAHGQRGSWVTLAPDGSLPRHALVAPADPHIEALAACFDGIETWERPESLRYWDAKTPLRDKVREALLYPHRPDGSEDRRINVTLSQDAVRAVAERLFTLVSIVEQNAISTFESPAAGYAPAQPALAAMDSLTSSLDALEARLPAVEAGEWDSDIEPEPTTMEP